MSTIPRVFLLRCTISGNFGQEFGLWGLGGLCTMAFREYGDFGALEVSAASHAPKFHMFPKLAFVTSLPSPPFFTKTFD